MCMAAICSGLQDIMDKSCSVGALHHLPPTFPLCPEEQDHTAGQRSSKQAQDSSYHKERERRRERETHTHTHREKQKEAERYKTQKDKRQRHTSWSERHQNISTDLGFNLIITGLAFT